ncbi:cell division protein SepF [Candidatus Woesearchaeota archaeon]|nr:cell division protein SepF [Candidatus Woesearchaeota archaeon]
MKKFISKVKETLGKPFSESSDSYPQEFSEDYVELDTSQKGPKSKVMVRPFVLTDFADVKPLLDSLREGYTIALVNIRSLREADVIEVKRAVNKIKKTCDAIGGDIAGFGDDWIVVTPGFASVYRNKQTESVEVE